MNVQVNQNERLIRPSDPAIRYTGRIDNSNPDAPFLIYVCSQVEFRVTGRVLRVFIENIHSFYENRRHHQRGGIRRAAGKRRTGD